MQLNPLSKIAYPNQHVHYFYNRLGSRHSYKIKPFVTILTRFLPHITLTFSDLTSSCVCVTLKAPDRARVLTPTWAASVVFFFLAQDPPKSPPQIPSFEHSCQC